MKIGFIRRGYSPTGGAEAYLLRLARGVAADGHEPVLVTSRDWPGEAWPNDSVIRVGNGGSPVAFAREAARAAGGCDVVLSLERVFECDVYRAGDGVHAAWLERRAAIEPAWRRWLRGTNRKHRELLRLERALFSPEGARRVIANSRMVRDEIVAHYDYPAERITVIENGYDTPPAEPGRRERRRAELGLRSGDFVALFAGSGWERKGLRTAVEAVRARSEVRLLVAGRGKPFAAPSNVRFLGPRHDLQGDFAAADVFVLPTVYDPFSNACLEALAAGLPVLTTHANGFAEIITEGVHGSIFAPGDVAALGSALHSWRERAAEARERCRALAARYSVAENTRRSLAVLTKPESTPA
jgi:UDP-glucose:(heptosyl)LPS alpha-1,3-glucosyltransferase